MIPEQGKVLVKFFAEWCGPCKMQSQIFERAGDIGVPIVEVDIDANMELAQQYQVRGVPTLVLVDNGAEINRKTGILMQGDIPEFLQG